MQVRLHPDPASFSGAIAGFLAADPFSANVAAANAARLAATDGSDAGADLWATVEVPDGRVVGVAMHTPPFNLFVSRMPAAAAAALADAIADLGRELPGVTGVLEATAAFAADWRRRTGHGSRRVCAMRLYRLAELRPPRGVAGHATVAGDRDLDLVTAWLAAFHQEATAHDPAQDWPATARRRVAAADVHLWCHGGAAVSLAAVGGPAAGVARIGPVYTPPAQRRRGYGAAVTAAASAAALAGGADHVVLYTNLANPTSNSVYQSIGYRPDHDAEERRFD